MLKELLAVEPRFRATRVAEVSLRLTPEERKKLVASCFEEVVLPSIESHIIQKHASTNEPIICEQNDEFMEVVSAPSSTGRNFGMFIFTNLYSIRALSHCHSCIGSCQRHFVLEKSIPVISIEVLCATSNTISLVCLTSCWPKKLLALEPMMIFSKVFL